MPRKKFKLSSVVPAMCGRKKTNKKVVVKRVRFMECVSSKSLCSSHDGDSISSTASIGRRPQHERTDKEKRKCFIQNDEYQAIRANASKFAHKIKRKHDAGSSFCTLIRSLADEKNIKYNLNDPLQKKIIDDIETWCQDDTGPRGLEDMTFKRLKFIRQMQRKHVITAVLQEQDRQILCMSMSNCEGTSSVEDDLRRVSCDLSGPGKKFAQAMAKFDSKAAGTYVAKDGKKGSYDLFCKDEYNKKKSSFIPKRFKV